MDEQQRPSGHPTPGNGWNNGFPNNGNPYNNNNLYRQAQVLTPKGDSLATAAMVTGIFAIVSFIILPIYLPFMFGGISIVLALLSKGKAAKMVSKAKAGIICAVAGLVTNVALTVLSFYLVFTVPDLMDQVNDMFEDIYGVTFEEMLDDIMEGENPYGY